MTRSYIVEWEDDELDEYESLEWDIPLDRRDISSDCPPDKSGSAHDETDIDERIAKGREIGRAERIIREEKSSDSTREERIWKKSCTPRLADECE